MKNFVIILILITGCSTNKIIHEIPLKPVIEHEIKISGFWLDEETGTVHKIIIENGKEKVVSVIKYKDGKSLEVMKIISSQNTDGKLHWIYFVPSTKYIVELTTSEISDNKVNVEWKNRSGEDEEESGSEILFRCSEIGISSDKMQGKITDTKHHDRSVKKEKDVDEYINESDLSDYL